MDRRFAGVYPGGEPVCETEQAGIQCWWPGPTILLNGMTEEGKKHAKGAYVDYEAPFKVSRKLNFEFIPLEQEEASSR